MRSRVEYFGTKQLPAQDVKEKDWEEIIKNHDRIFSPRFVNALLKKHGVGMFKILKNNTLTYGEGYSICREVGGKYKRFHRGFFKDTATALLVLMQRTFDTPYSQGVINARTEFMQELKKYGLSM